MQSDRPPIEIEALEVAPSLAARGGASFDLPRPGPGSSLVVRVAMWFRRPQGERPGQVRLATLACAESDPQPGDLRLVAAAARPDVSCEDATTALGFDVHVDAVELPRTFQIVATYHPPSGGDVELGRVRGRRGFLAGSYPGTFQPLLVCSQGRMGTTALMMALAVHPLCAAGDRYPFEDAQAAYYARVAMALLRTPDLRYREDAFANDLRYHVRTRRAVGANPYLHGDYRSPEEVEALLAAQAEPTADFARRSIDRVYSRLAALAGKRNSAIYCLEKAMRPAAVNELLWLYPRVKLIVLTRDPRDVFRSAREFNAKRGFASFLREQCSDEASWIDLYSGRISCLVDLHDQHPAADRLHVRFEDLVRDPHAELARIGRFVGPTPTAVVDAMATALCADDALSRRHRTRPAGAEVGCWSGSLSPAEVDRILARTTMYRQRFGYGEG